MRQHAELMPEHVRSKALIAPPAFARLPSLIWSCTALMRSSYEYKNYLLLVQEFVRTSFWGKFARH
ncbi:hypothetical protein C3Y90_04415 [Rhizobium sp. UPM1134]|nr:hypothetical protein [Rhizobium ruizarguesonis]